MGTVGEEIIIQPTLTRGMKGKMRSRKCHSYKKRKKKPRESDKTRKYKLQSSSKDRPAINQGNV